MPPKRKHCGRANGLPAGSRRSDRVRKRSSRLLTDAALSSAPVNVRSGALDSESQRASASGAPVPTPNDTDVPVISSVNGGEEDVVALSGSPKKYVTHPLPANATKTKATSRDLKRFVLKKHCLPLLDVIAANRAAYDAAIHGSTHAKKENGRKKLTLALIATVPATRKCFGSDKYIEEDGATKMAEVLRTLKKKYRVALELSKNSTGWGDEDVHKIWEPFAGCAYEEARGKAHAHFPDSPAVHLHGV